MRKNGDALLSSKSIGKLREFTALIRGALRIRISAGMGHGNSAINVHIMILKHIVYNILILGRQYYEHGYVSL